jgi:N-acetylglucosaminyl-diphospho-decaprenol L-rhamnosyltransferase
MTPGRVAVIVVSWNLRDNLRECLASLPAETKRHPCDVIVVDNGSAHMAAAQFPAARLLRQPENLGFVRASNIGLRHSLETGRPDDLLLLSADIIIRDGAIDRLADHLDASPEAGAAGPLLVLPDGRLQPGPAGFRPTLGSAVVYFGFAGKLFPRAARPLFIDPEAALRMGWGRPMAVDRISGACLMVRSEVVRRVGLMNERFRLFDDDIEWGE